MAPDRTPPSVSHEAEPPERIPTSNSTSSNSNSTANASTLGGSKIGLGLNKGITGSGNGSGSASSNGNGSGSTGLTLGDRTRTHSISYPVGADASRKGSVVDGDCPLCRNDRIHGPRDVLAAFKLTWIKNRKHLLITWIHVPIGVTLMLVVVWAIKLGIDRTSFRFPSAVLTMIIFLIVLLTLDLLSIKFPGRDAKNDDIEDKVVPAPASQRNRKRFLDPFMKLLAPPADFLLRNMSVMFTPAFIMIPAREVIPGREIGILAAYFTLTQVLGYVFPVLLCMLVDWLFGLGPRRRRAKEAEKQFENLRRNSVIGAGSGFGHPIEKGLAEAGRVKDAPILAGLFTSSVVAFAPLRPVQPVLHNVPEDEVTQLTHVAIELARQQGVGPAVAPMSRADKLAGTPRSDVSTFQHPARRHAHMKRTKSDGFSIPSASRRAVSGTTSFADSTGRTPKVPSAESQPVDPASMSPKGTTTITPPLPQYEVEELAPDMVEPALPAPAWTSRGPMPALAPIIPEGYEFPPRTPYIPDARRPSILEEGPYSTFSAPEVPQVDRPSQADSGTTPSPPAPTRIAFDPVLETAASVRAADADADEDEVVEMNRQPSSQQQQQQQPILASQQASRRNSLFSPSNPGTRRNSLTIIASRASSRLNSKTGSQIDLKAAAAAAAASGQHGKSGDHANDGEDDNNNNNEKTPAPSIRCRHNSIAESTISCGPNAVERLADWFGDLISPTVYATLILVGLPLYFVLDFSLPLFLGINLLIFIGAITVVPPKVRRFAHPILTTSIGTVLVIWAFSAMKGRDVKETLLSSYQVNAKYYDIWRLDGYSGPVPGAGDFLISTLDAGIVALAVPCYRYRAELRESFFRLICVLVPCAALSLFVWPGIAHLITLDRSRSLAFAARFMSTPLAIELNNTLGGDENIVVILVVITGIVAAILKEPFFKMMRVSMDDHFIVGATFGATSGAIGASSLIARPKVMAVASLSFVIFGAVLLFCAAIPPLVDVVRTVAGF